MRYYGYRELQGVREGGRVPHQESHGRNRQAGITVWRVGSAFNRGIDEEGRGQYDGLADIFGTCAGCSLYRASALRRVRPF